MGYVSAESARRLVISESPAPPLAFVFPPSLPTLRHVDQLELVDWDGLRLRLGYVVFNSHLILFSLGFLQCNAIVIQ